ncbi:thiamine biosynthesis/tRNA modification protein ThiI [Treponema primitia ZAS-2]|uniref:Probable tRNA sulfurtransferase n=1 Tax=Treponema primitia (strain ATCC BAA-887 / DSM 12427 / ZAS-2) TaxID=545694 RepID=F5YPZ3_TREPZ|nr:tRNA uracil 4-sulfurtransferase ThiI [Treponema primitia]AEF85795.1 thiamine biosynthesis/tRNA modification protein ThiI [Treponema primitia ZAS-2]
MAASESSLYLLKLGELTLKGGNRAGFEDILERNLRDLLRGTGAKILTTAGRFYVRTPQEGEARVEETLDRLMGISGWAKTRICEKSPQAVFAVCVAEGKALAAQGIESFKIEARRTDKSFPLDSYGIARGAGDAVSEAVPELRVDVRKPQGVITVEIRERAYIYGFSRQGRRGLPVGTAGRGLLLLSGGIDSPVAGYMMASRGMKIDAVYFHAYPYTSEEARQKVVKLAEIVGRFSLGIRLFTVGFTSLQMRIKEQAPEEWTTVLLRMAMMECAEKLAKHRRSKCLITGESLSQVASQTIENINCTGSRVKLPILRPLIGMDKESIIRAAVELGTYETSILPYPDCCVLFSPPHPVLRGDIGEANRLYEGLELGEMIDTAIRESVMERCSFPG